MRIKQCLLVLVSELLAIAHSSPAGGACTTSDDCVAPNVCSKWGWCQWTKIYGEDGPSQGAEAPAGGRAGQCRTSADCASRVPYCSDLGYCHGGTLPFDEAQLEIADEDKQAAPEDRPIGFVNNNVRKNSPVFQTATSSNARGTRNNNRKSGSSRTSNNRGSSSSSGALPLVKWPRSLGLAAKQYGHHMRNGT